MVSGLLVPGLALAPPVRDSLFLPPVATRGVAFVPTAMYRDLTALAAVAPVCAAVGLTLLAYTWWEWRKPGTRVVDGSGSRETGGAAEIKQDAAGQTGMFPTLVDDSLTQLDVAEAHVLLLRPQGVLSPSFALTGDDAVCLIGRSDECNLVVDDKRVSRRHAQIAYRKDLGWYITCLSPLGMLVDGRLVRGDVTIPLGSSARLSLGHALIAFEGPNAHGLPDSETLLPSPDGNHRAMLVPLRSDGTQDGVIFPLSEQLTHIGRAEQDNRLVLTDARASRHHVVITYEEGEGFHLEDLQSAAGTYIEGRRITAPAVLRHMQIIRFASQEYRFEFEVTPDEPTAI